MPPVLCWWSDEPTALLREIERFFNVYKNLEERRSLTFGWSGKAEAYQRIETCRVKES